MKNIFKFGLWIVVIIFIITGCGAKPGVQSVPKNDISTSKVQKAVSIPVLKVGTVAINAPFEFIDENTNQITGFDADFIKAVAEAAGMKAELTHVADDSLYTALETKKVDVLISAMVIENQERQEANFSMPYFEVKQLVATVAGSTYKDLKSLTAKMVGVQGNSTGQYILEKTPGFKKDNIRPYATIPEALMDLANGSVVAVVGDAPSILYFVQTNRDAKITVYDANLGKEYYSIAVKKDDAQLLSKIDIAIKKVKASGKYDEIYKKYFGK